MIGNELICYKNAIQVFDKYSIPYIKPLAICKLELALKYKNDFPSTICEYYGLEVQQKNICEGTVIKPYCHEYSTYNGSRIILKNKNKAFSEKKHTKVKSEIPELSEKANKLISELESYITENRFNAVFSKKEYTKQNFGMCLGDFIKDLREDAKKDGVKFDEIEAEESKRVNKTINTKSVTFIKELFFNKI